MGSGFRRAAWAQGGRGRLLRARRKIQDADILQIAVALAVIESVADHKFVRDLKSDVVSFHLVHAPRRLVEQRGNAQNLRLALLQDSQQIAQREAGIENILDQE